MERRPCPRCGRQVLAGLSNGGRAAALDVQLDPLELTPLGELDALHSGRLTWTVHHTGDVFARSTLTIEQRPAGQTWRQAVHADHVCTEEGTA